MNCAPIQVGTGTGAASTASVVDALGGLPDMFVINLPSTQCANTAYEDFQYPNPGKNVIVGTKNVKLGSTISIDTGCALQNKMGAGAGQLGSPSQGAPSTPSQGTSPAAPSKSSIPSQPSNAPSQSQASQKPVATPGSGYGTPQPSKIPTNPNGGVYAPGASSAPAAVPSPQSPPAAAQPSPPAPKPVPSTTPQTPGGNTSSPSNGDCTPCTNDGAVVCIGSKQFGLCNRGCAVAQDLAAGMTCSAGAVVASTKRHLHFPRAHLHRRFTAARFL